MNIEPFFTTFPEESSGLSQRWLDAWMSSAKVEKRKPVLTIARDEEAGEEHEEKTDDLAP